MKETKPKLTPDERVKKCGEAIQTAMRDYGCQLYSALRIGNAETPLLEIGGLPTVVKLATNDQPTVVKLE